MAHAKNGTCACTQKKHLCIKFNCECVFHSLPCCDCAQRCRTYHRYVQENSQHLDKLKEFLPSFDGTKESVESSLPLFTLYLILHCTPATFFSVWHRVGSVWYPLNCITCNAEIKQIEVLTRSERTYFFSSYAQKDEVQRLGGARFDGDRRMWCVCVCARACDGELWMRFCCYPPFYMTNLYAAIHV